MLVVQRSWQLLHICHAQVLGSPHLGEHQAVVAPDDVAPLRQAGLRAELCDDAHLQRADAAAS